MPKKIAEIDHYKHRQLLLQCQAINRTLSEAWYYTEPYEPEFASTDATFLQCLGRIAGELIKLLRTAAWQPRAQRTPSYQ